MRLLEEAYQINNSGLGDVRIFSERTFGYKRFIVDWGDGNTTMFSSLWYKLDRVKQIVEERIYPE